MSGQSIISYRLKDGLVLDAYSLVPGMREDELRQSLREKDKPTNIDLEEIAKDTIFKTRVNNVEGLGITFSGTEYKLPEQLQPARDEFGRVKADAGWYNGKVMVAEWDVGTPLKVSQGGYFDFMVSKLGAVPGELLPDQYPKKVPVETLFEEWGVNFQKRCKYVGIAYNLSTENGRDLCLVQRAKGLGIAADCIALPGSTPNPDFSEEGFDINKYLSEHIVDEMAEEFKLNPGEFNVNGIYLFDDLKQVPFLAVDVKTPLQTSEIARRSYGDKNAIKEHPTLYSVSKANIKGILNGLPVFPPVSLVMDQLAS